MNVNSPMPSWLRLAITSCVLVSSGAARLPAQSRSAPSDAVIWISPAPGDQALLNVNFPARVPHGDVRQRIDRLAQLTGWRFSHVDIKETDVRTNAKFGPVMAIGVWTNASATLSGAPQATVSGGFMLQPYVEAFSDLGHIQIFYWIPADPAFRGVREFTDPALSVKLIQPGGPYRYDIEIRSHGKPLPKIPILESQARPAAASGSSTSGAVSTEDRSVFAAVVAVAAGAGFAVLITLLIVSHLRTTHHRDVRPLPPRAG